MRKVVYTFLLAASAALVVMVGAASGAKRPHVVILRCKPGNVTNTCTLPTLIVGTPSAVCHKAGAKVTVPAITSTANAGIRKITVKVGNKTLKTFSFKGAGPTSKTIRGLKVSTRGLKHGIYVIKVTVTDTRGKTKTTTRRFAICKPAPVFTG